MSLRQYAAIQLRVPNSGTDWLDEMIRESKRDEFAGQALAAADLNDLYFGTVAQPHNPWPHLARHCYTASDAMLAAREEGGVGNER
ncbi:MAG: hypothetical protein ACX94C_07565 [Phycisphaerales bacterium]